MNASVGSLWENLAPPAPHCATLQGEVTADLIVVGAGFLGLSTALHAAEGGLSVVLLEAELPGFGASGRNTGFVVPSLKANLGPAEVRSALGDLYADRLLRLVADSGNRVAKIISDHAIECNFEQNGWLQPAHSSLQEQQLKGRLQALLSSGVEVEFLPRDNMHALTGIPSLHGGLRIASGGQLVPLSYARGLAQACLAAGVRIYAESPVGSLEREGAQWAVRTPGGVAKAPRVFMATNAMIGNLIPKLRDSIVPVKIYQVATNRLDVALRKRILPANAPVADTRRHTFALRWSPDGRLITGGMVALRPGREECAREQFLGRIRRFVPDVGDIQADYMWTGTIAATLDALPRLMELEESLWAAIGCNGRGVALTSALGHACGGLLAGRVGVGDFVLPITGPRNIPFGRWSAIAPHFWLPISNFRDDREARKG